MTSVNFTSLLPLSTKQKEQLAVKAVLAERPDYYNLPLAERINLRTAAVNALSTVMPKAHPQGKTVTPNTTPFPVEVDSIHDKLGYKQEKEINHDNTTTNDTLTIPTGISLATSPEFDTASSELTTDALQTPTKDIGPVGTEIVKHTAFALNIVLNARQEMGADFAQAGKSFVYTGAAGTGKTTGCREISKRLLQSGLLGEHNFRVDGVHINAPSIAICAWTNRATNNMRRALHKDPQLEAILQYNILTFHKLLEYQPEFYVREDGSNGMRFIPMRTATNPLRLTHLIIEEGSQLGLDMWKPILAALPSGCQIIFVGDINQLQPIFSPSILNYALVALPVVELTEVYRQALDNPIIENAHHCLKGEALVEKLPYFRLVKGQEGGSIPSESKCVQLMINSLQKWVDTPLVERPSETTYDPNQDIILCPYGKENKDKGSQANTTVINNYIAQFLGAKRNAMVWEILASMRTLYLAVGDRVMVDKQDGIITKIAHNARYVGRMPKPASTELTRHGVRLFGSSKDGAQDEDFDLMMEGYENLDVSKIPDEVDDKKKLEASHVVEVTLDSGRVEVLHQAGDFSDSSFSLGYALTIHKAQGCEWRRVFILLHRNHAQMLTRELIYTAITRAREYCTIIDLCNQVQKGITNQKVKGNSVQEKIEWFNSEVSLREPVQVCP